MYIFTARLASKVYYFPFLLLLGFHYQLHPIYVRYVQVFSTLYRFKIKKNTNTIYYYYTISLRPENNTIRDTLLIYISRETIVIAVLRPRNIICISGESQRSERSYFGIRHILIN